MFANLNMNSMIGHKRDSSNTLQRPVLGRPTTYTCDRKGGGLLTDSFISPRTPKPTDSILTPITRRSRRYTKP